MSKDLLKRLTAACALSFLSISGVSAFDLKVVVTDEVTGQRTGDISLTAHDPKDLSLLRSADYVAFDTTFLFKDLPDREVLVMWPEGLDMHSAPARPDMEVLNIKAKIEQETQLKEVVVQGMSRYMTDDGQVYIPSKQERKAAFDATSLLSMLAIPTLSVSGLGGGVTTSSGEAVSIFINYLPASSEEVSGLRPMEIEKVEVLDYPKDPRFNGAQHVINYIITEYVYGGFTRLSATQQIIADTRDYSLYSKMRYRAMTYDLSGGYGYRETRHAGSSSEETYLLSDMAVVKRIEPEYMRTVSHSPYASLKATYQGENSVIANTVGFSFQNRPVKQKSVTTYTPDVVDSDWEETDTRNRNLTLTWNGEYRWSLPHSYMRVVRPTFSYGHISSDYSTTGRDYHIVNDAREKSLDYDLRAYLSRQFGQQLLDVSFWGRHTDDAIEYVGSSATDIHNHYTHAVLSLMGNLRFGKFWSFVRLQGNWSRSETNGRVRFNNLDSHYMLVLGYNPTQRTRLQLSSNLYFGTPSMSEITQDIFLQSPLFAITGNPYLKQSRYNDVGGTWTQFLSETFSMSANVGYNRLSNIITESYERSSYDGREIILRGYANMPHFDRLNYGVSLSGRFLSNSLTGTVRVGGEYADRHTTTKRSMNALNYSADITWFHGNWYVSGGYESERKRLTDTGWTNMHPIYYLSAGWGNGEWNLNVGVVNPFSDSWEYMKSWIESPVYNSMSTGYNFTCHCRIQISAAWSISYGKKVEQKTDLNAPEQATSAILH